METPIWSVLIVAFALTSAGKVLSVNAKTTPRADNHKVAGIMAGVSLLQFSVHSTQSFGYKAVVAVYMVAEVAADIVSTSVLVWYLYKPAFSSMCCLRKVLTYYPTNRVRIWHDFQSVPSIQAL